jgi:hypothetical protein
MYLMNICSLLIFVIPTTLQNCTMSAYTEDDPVTIQTAQLEILLCIYNHLVRSSAASTSAPVNGTSELSDVEIQRILSRSAALLSSQLTLPSIRHFSIIHQNGMELETKKLDCTFHPVDRDCDGDCRRLLVRKGTVQVAVCCCQ